MKSRSLAHLFPPRRRRLAKNVAIGVVSAVAGIWLVIGVSFARFYTSDAFEKHLEAVMKRRLARVQGKTPKLNIKDIYYDGIDGFNLGPLAFKARRKGATIVPISNIAVNPWTLWSLAGDLKLHISIEAPKWMEKGRFTAKIRRGADWSEPGRETSLFTSVRGYATDVDAATALEILQPLPSPTGLRLLPKNDIQLDFDLTDLKERQGRVRIWAAGLDWRVKLRRSVQTVRAERFNTNIVVRGRQFRLKKPLIIKSSTGHVLAAQGGGRIALKKRRRYFWNLKFGGKPNQAMKVTVARMFGCRKVPRSPRWAVRGWHGRARCVPTQRR